MNKQYIQKMCYDMKEGDCLRIDGRLFKESFLFGWPTIYNIPEEAFLSSMIGSAWGKFRVTRCYDTGDYIISKHKEEDRRYYVDPDRKHLFKTNLDGTLDPIV